jgi:hypothetical protein
VQEICMLRSMWRGLETESSDHRASSRPYQSALRTPAALESRRGGRVCEGTGADHSVDSRRLAEMHIVVHGGS